MIGGIIGRRYAKALLNLAEMKMDVEEVGVQIGEMATVYQSSQALKDVIIGPLHNLKQKGDIINKISQKSGCGDLVNKFCRFLVAKSRFELIPEIASSYQVQANEMLGKATADITVARELSKEERQKLQRKLSEFTGKKITLVVNEDPTILGGAITTIGSLVFDGSVKNRLNLIRETISEVN
jgi:F-type H+-transporting ATPase subunit delta